MMDIGTLRVDKTTFRTVVWEEMLFADMRANYFAELMCQYLRFDRALRVATLVASSGDFATALLKWDSDARVIAPVLATAVSFWPLISQYRSMARDASDLHAGWSQVGRDYERLWNSFDSPEAEATYHQIYDRAEALSKSGGKFPYKKGRLSYWLDQTAAIANTLYA
jgi:hypothetical protein